MGNLTLLSDEDVREYAITLARTGADLLLAECTDVELLFVLHVQIGALKLLLAGGPELKAEISDESRQFAALIGASAALSAVAMAVSEFGMNVYRKSGAAVPSPDVQNGVIRRVIETVREIRS